MDEQTPNLPVVWQPPRGEKTYTSYTEHKVAVILRSLARGATRTAACGAARISRQTFYEWLKEIPDFKLMVSHAEGLARAVVEDKLWGLIESGDGAAIRFFLQTRYGKDFRRADTIINQKNETHIHNHAEAVKKARERVYARTGRKPGPGNPAA